MFKQVNSNGKFYSCSIVKTKEERIALLSEFVDPVERRLLRSITDYNIEPNDEETTKGFSTEEESVTIENEQQAQGNGTLLEHRGAGENPIEIIYMNCSMDSITCATVVCRFKLSKTFEDVGNLLLDMTFDSGIIYKSNIYHILKTPSTILTTIRLYFSFCSPQRCFRYCKIQHKCNRANYRASNKI